MLAIFNTPIYKRLLWGISNKTDTNWNILFFGTIPQIVEQSLKIVDRLHNKVERASKAGLLILNELKTK